MNVEEAIESVYRAHKKSGLYDGSFEDVIYKLTNAYDYFYIGAIKDIQMLSLIGRPFHNIQLNLDDFDKYRHSYRACLKFVHEDCHRAAFTERVTEIEIFNYQNEIREAFDFNFIRNTIDRYQLGEYSATIEDGVLHFHHTPGIRGLEYDYYSRLLSQCIPGGKNDQDSSNLSKLHSEIIATSLTKIDFESKKSFKPHRQELRRTIAAFKQYYLRDSDTKILKLKPLGYSIDEYLTCYAYLAAIAFYKTAYLISLAPNNRLTYQPSILYPKNRLIDDISDITDIPHDIVERIVSDLVYDYDFHKNSVTIFQPLFELDGKILFSSSLILHSYVIDKMMKFADHMQRNQVDLTAYHKIMSNQMNHRMANYLSQTYDNLMVFENKTLSLGGKDVAEIDLIIIDKSTKSGAFVELKNYSQVDNDLDAFSKEKKINMAIWSRLEKERLILNNLKEFFGQNHIPMEYLEVSFSSLLVTNAFAGGTRIKEDIKVIDEPLFYFLINLCSGNLKVFLDDLNSKDFFKIIKEDHLSGNGDVVYEYKGIKARVTYDSDK